MTPGKRRQAEYRARMLAEGKRQYAFWLTPEQAEEIRVYLAGEQSRLTPAQSEEVPRPEPEPDKVHVVKVEPSKPDRRSEYLVMQGDKPIGRVWQTDDIPKWMGYPSGFNDRQFAGSTRQAVIERIERYRR